MTSEIPPPQFVAVSAREMVLLVGNPPVRVDWDNPAAHRAVLAEIERGRK